MAVYKRGEIYWGEFERKGERYRGTLETTSKREANKRLKDWISRVEKGEWQNKDDRMPLSKLLESFIEHHFDTLSDLTRKRYASSIKWLGEYFDGMYLDEITAAKLYTFMSKRKQTVVKRKGWKKSKNIEGSTIIRDLNTLSSMFTHGQDDLEWEINNPVPALIRKQKKRNGLKDSDPKKRYLSPSEENRLFAASFGSNSNPFCQKQMIATIDLGVRKEEMAGLTWEVQDKNRLFEVDLKKEMVTVTGKRNKIRQIPILPRTLEMLKSMPRHFNSPYVFYYPEGATP